MVCLVGFLVIRLSTCSLSSSRLICPNLMTARTPLDGHVTAPSSETTLAILASGDDGGSGGSRPLPPSATASRRSAAQSRTHRVNISPPPSSHLAPPSSLDEPPPKETQCSTVAQPSPSPPCTSQPRRAPTSSSRALVRPADAVGACACTRGRGDHGT